MRKRNGATFLFKVAVVVVLLVLMLEPVKVDAKSSSLEEAYKKQADSIASQDSVTSFQHSRDDTFGDTAKKEKRGASTMKEKSSDKEEAHQSRRVENKAEARYNHHLGPNSIPTNPKAPVGTYDYYDENGKLHVVSYVNDELGYRVLNDYLPYESLSENPPLKSEEQMLLRDPAEMHGRSKEKSKYDLRGHQTTFYDSRPFTVSSTSASSRRPYSSSSSGKYYGRIPPSYGSSGGKTSVTSPYYGQSSLETKTQQAIYGGDSDIVLPILYQNSDSASELTASSEMPLFSSETLETPKIPSSDEELEDIKSMYAHRPSASSNPYATSMSSSIPMSPHATRAHGNSLGGNYGHSDIAYGEEPYQISHGSSGHSPTSYPGSSSLGSSVESYPIASGPTHSIGAYPVSTGGSGQSLRGNTYSLSPETSHSSIGSYPMSHGSRRPLGGYSLSSISGHPVSSYPLSSGSGHSVGSYPLSSLSSHGSGGGSYPVSSISNHGSSGGSYPISSLSSHGSSGGSYSVSPGSSPHSISSSYPGSVIESYPSSHSSVPGRYPSSAYSSHPLTSHSLSRYPQKFSLRPHGSHYASIPHRHVSRPYSSSPSYSYKRPLSHNLPPRRPLGISGYLGSANQASHQYNSYQKPPKHLASFLNAPYHYRYNPIPHFLNHF